VLEGDMARFSLGMRFPLIIIPFRGFQALTEYQAARSCLISIREHLTADGHLLFDVFRTSRHPKHAWHTGEYTDWVHRDRPTGRVIRRKGRRREIDLVNQIMYSDVIYEITDKAGATERLVDPLALKYWYQYQLEVLLITCGFAIHAVYGYYNRAPAGSGPELIFDCSVAG
jgi:hypothetical protein